MQESDQGRNAGEAEADVKPVRRSHGQVLTQRQETRRSGEVEEFTVEREMPSVDPHIASDVTQGGTIAVASDVNPNDILASLSEVCGRGAVRLIDRGGDILQTNQEYPVVLVTPHDEDEVVKIMRTASQSGWKVRVMGAGTQLASGRPGSDVHIAMSMEGLNQMVEFAPADLVVTVQPGITIQALQTVLAAEGKMLPLDPWLPPQATIGGIAATAASGPRRAIYGTVRDMAIGLRVVYPDGTVVRTGGKVVKNVAGYDMTKLFVGSAGTLGVITELTFKLRPLPLHRETVLLSGNREQIVRVQKQLLGSVLIAARAEAMSASMLTRASTPMSDSTAMSVPIPPPSISGEAAEENGPDWVLAVDCDENESSARYQRDELHAWADAEGTDFTYLANEDADAWWERAKASVLDADVVLRVAAPSSQWERLAKRVTGFAAETGFDVKQTWGVTVGVGRVFIRGHSHRADVTGHPTDVTGHPTDANRQPVHSDGTSDAQFTHEVAQLIFELRQMSSELGGSTVVERAGTDVREAVDPFGISGGTAVLFERIKRQIDPKGVLSPGSYAGGI